MCSKVQLWGTSTSTSWANQIGIWWRGVFSWKNDLNESSGLKNIIKKMQYTPLFLCGFRDPIVEDYNTIPLNSLTGFNMFTSFLKITQ